MPRKSGTKANIKGAVVDGSQILNNSTGNAPTRGGSSTRGAKRRRTSNNVNSSGSTEIYGSGTIIAANPFDDDHHPTHHHQSHHHHHQQPQHTLTQQHHQMPISHNNTATSNSKMMMMPPPMNHQPPLQQQVHPMQPVSYTPTGYMHHPPPPPQQTHHIAHPHHQQTLPPPMSIHTHAQMGGTPPGGPSPQMQDHLGPPQSHLPQASQVQMQPPPPPQIVGQPQQHPHHQTMNNHGHMLTGPQNYGSAPQQHPQPPHAPQTQMIGTSTPPQMMAPAPSHSPYMHHHPQGPPPPPHPPTSGQHQVNPMVAGPPPPPPAPHQSLTPQPSPHLDPTQQQQLPLQQHYIVNQSIYCGKCQREIYQNEQNIVCKAGCRSYYHISCSGLTQLACDLLMKESHAEWACDRCITGNRRVPFVKYKT